MDTDLKLGKFHTDLPSNRAWVLGTVAFTASNSGQVVDTHVPLSPGRIIWYRPRGGDALRLELACV